MEASDIVGLLPLLDAGFEFLAQVGKEGAPLGVGQVAPADAEAVSLVIEGGVEGVTTVGGTSSVEDAGSGRACGGEALEAEAKREVDILPVGEEGFVEAADGAKGVEADPEGGPGDVISLAKKRWEGGGEFAVVVEGGGLGVEVAADGVDPGGVGEQADLGGDDGGTGCLSNLEAGLQCVFLDPGIIGEEEGSGVAFFGEGAEAGIDASGIASIFVEAKKGDGISELW